MCDSWINRAFFIFFIAVCCINVYAINNLKLDVNDSQLMLLNTWLVFFSCIMLCWGVGARIYYYCCTKRTNKTQWDPNVLATLNASASSNLAQKDLTNCTLTEWTIAFERLAKNFPQNAVNKGFHQAGCTCAQKCIHLVTPCRIAMDVPIPAESDAASSATASNLTRRHLTYKHMALVRHAQECNCKCFDDG
jgi:hypothetical protein